MCMQQIAKLGWRGFFGVYPEAMLIPLMIITLRISISFRPIVRCTAVSSSHSPSGVAFSLVFEFSDLRLNPRVVCCADTAPQPFYLSLTLPSFRPTSPGVLPSPARSHGWCGRGCRRRCRRRAPKLFEDGVLAITHPLPPRASSACAPACRPRCQPASTIGLAYAGALVQAQP